MHIQVPDGAAILGGVGYTSLGYPHVQVDYQVPGCTSVHRSSEHQDILCTKRNELAFLLV